MSVRFSKKHIRRQRGDVYAEWVSVEDTGLLVTVAPPSWSAPRTFDFTSLRPFASIELAQALARAFGEFAARFARRTSAGRYEAFIRLWRSVAAKKKVPPNASCLRSGELAEWWGKKAHAHMVGEYRRAAKKTSAKTSTQSAAVVLDEFASCGLLVDVVPPETPKNLHLRKVPRPGLVELTRNTTKATDDEKSELVRHFRSIGIPVEDAEAEEHIALLAGLLTPEERKDPKKATQAYFTRTNEYLLALTNSAEIEFLKWQGHYRYGQELLSSANAHVIAAYDAKQFHQQSNTVFRRFFPKNDSQTATANFLLLVKERFKWCVPTDAALEAPFRSRVMKLTSELGGKLSLDARLTLHRNGVAAAAFLYIRDTGANVSTCLSLTPEFEGKTSEAGVVEFFAVKARANYKAIFDCLPVNDPGRRISTVKALRATREMTAALRLNFPELSQSLFAFRFFAEPSIASAEFLSHQFRYLLDAAKLPSGWTLSGIRTAVGISHTLDGTGTLRGVARKLHHGKTSAATTAGYVLRWPVRKSLELQMAKYQGLFEAGLASNLDGALAWLGKSPNESAQLLQEARRTGLGFLCAAPDAGARPGTAAGKPCGKTGECPQCEVHLFVLDEESLAEVIATNLSLKLNDARLQQESAERYEGFWIELLAFTTAAINAAKRGPYAYLMPRARRKAESWILNGFDITDLRP